eukprot:13472_1
MSTTPTPTVNQDASIGQQVFVFISYTITTFAVGYFIIRLIKSICNPSSAEQTADNSSSSITVSVEKTKGQKIIFWTSFITICLFFYRSVLVWAGFLYHLASEDDNDHENLAISISFIGYGLGLWLMLYTFVARIDYTFRGTFLAYSMNTIRVLYVFVFVLLLFTLVLVVFDSIEDYDTVGGWLLPLILILHFLFSGLVIYLLFRKVFVLMKQKVYQCEDNNKDNSDQTTEQGMIIELNTIDSFTRFGLLIFIGIISTYVLSIINNVTLLLEDDHAVKQLGVGYVLIAVDLFVNALVVYLLFPMNTQQYNCCCKYCHLCCQKCCMNCVYMNMKRDNATNKNKEEFVELILS